MVGDEYFIHPSSEVRELLSQLQELTQSEDVPKRAKLLEYILTLVTLEDFPLLWAKLHIELGHALRQNPTQKPEALRRSIICYDAAATIYTYEEMLADWVRIQYYKGSALHKLAWLLAGGERETTMRSALACYDAILTVGDYLSIRVDRTTFLHELASLYTGSMRDNLLQEALNSLNEVLQDEYREQDPATWAAAQSNKGTVLRKQAALQTDLEQQRAIIKAALACYDAALLVYDDKDTSINWAATQNNKGETLSYLAGLMAGEAYQRTLREAIACYDAALTGSPYWVTQPIWAAIHNNKGSELYNLSRWLMGAERVDMLHAALACFDIVLLERGKESIFFDWVQVQRHKGVVLCDLATQLVDTERIKKLQEAIACFDAALDGCDSNVVSHHWIAIQNDKGAALRDLADLLRGPGRAGALRASVGCFEAVLQKISREKSPAAWVKTQNNKSMVLRDFGAALGLVARERTGPLRIKMLQTAIFCCDEALTVSTHEKDPDGWSRIQNNKGNALRELASALTDGVERKIVSQAAITCYNNALLEQRRELNPTMWAMMQNNKAVTLRELTKSLTGDELVDNLQEIVACYDAVVSVYTREVLPADHYRITYSIGMYLFQEGDWKNAARYLATALDALDDLFVLEITTYGRKATLKAGNDLTAHLAYAFIRTGTVDAAKRAAEVLERGRGRITGEMVTRQEAQLTAASKFVPEALLEQFHAASDRLMKISFVGGASDTLQIELSPKNMEVAGEAAEKTALIAANTRLFDYQEAQAARRSYNAIVKRIRDILPDFLLQEKSLDTALLALAPDERLTYLATTSLGAVALLVGNAPAEGGIPIAEYWVDELLTSEKIARLLIGSASEKDKSTGENPGLLAAQSVNGTLGRALLTAMETLGISDGVLAHLAIYCRAAKIRRLIFVPCGLFGLLPLHAALVPTAFGDQDVEPFLDVVQVSYTPGAHIWANCEKRTKEYRAGQINALLVSDPQPRDFNMSPLPGAEDEVLMIDEIITHKVSGQAFSYYGIAATLPALLDGLKTYGAILTHVHFACHGQADLNNPYNSGLLLAQGDRLMARDLLDSTVVHLERLRVAVLSACQTALTGTELPDEVIGLSAGWLQAGAMAVLASLWPVSDNKTVALMIKFYELHLLDKCDPIEAFWLAQRWFRQLPTWREDCQKSGASWAARGPQVNEIMRDLEPALPQRGKKNLDEHTHLVDPEMGHEDAQRNFSSHVPAEQDRTMKEKFALWEDAQYWAAFAVYGA